MIDDHRFVAEDYRFVAEWDENTDIDWWNKCRRVLNKAIRLYNDWQMDHDFDPAMARRVLATIAWARVHVDIDGGSAYLAELDEMAEFVNGRMT